MGYCIVHKSNLRGKVTIYLRKYRLEVVAIKEFNGTLIIGIIFLALGLLVIII